MTTDRQEADRLEAQKRLETLWEIGFDEGWFFKGYRPNVDRAMNWLIKNHERGQEFVDQIKKCIYEINEAQMILADIDNDLLSEGE